AWFTEEFRAAVDRRRISDVPVGVLLSGGLDSSSVAAALAESAGAGVASFTVRFPEAAYDEGAYAKLTAVRSSAEYHEVNASDDQLASTLEQACWFNDEPLAHGNDLYVLAIARYAKEHATVLLSGEGADETLGGYVRYRPLGYPRTLAALRPFASPLA